MFLFSTVYHAMSYDSPQKYVLRIIDHSMIYIAIAGWHQSSLPWWTDGLQHYLDPMGHYHLWYFTQDLPNTKSSVSPLYLIAAGWSLLFEIVSQTNWSSGVSCHGASSYTVGSHFYKKNHTSTWFAPLSSWRLLALFKYFLVDCIFYGICSPLLWVVFWFFLYNRKTVWGQSGLDEQISTNSFMF